MGAGMAKLSVALKSEPLLLQKAPSPREAHSTVDLGCGKLLVFGGGTSLEEEAEQYNDVHILDLTEQIWTKIKAKGVAPSPRTGQTAACLPGGRVLVFGGCSMDSGYLDDTHLLDTSTFMWTQPLVTGNPPTPRDKQTSVSLGSKVYIFGGFGPQPEKSAPEAEEESAKGLEDLSDGWETDEESEPSARPGGLEFTWFNDLHEFDASTGVWREVETSGQAPNPRAAAAAVLVAPSTVGDAVGVPKMVLFGGRDSAGRQNDLYSLDLTTFEWRQERPSTTTPVPVAESQGSEDPSAAPPDVPAAPPARSFHSMAPLTGARFEAALLFGGVGLKNENFQGLDVLNVRTMDWSTVGALEGTWPSPRGACSMNVVQERPGSSPKLVIFGGSSDWEGGKAGFHNDVFVTDLGPLIKALEESENDGKDTEPRQHAVGLHR